MVAVIPLASNYGSNRASTLPICTSSESFLDCQNVFLAVQDSSIGDLVTH